MTLGEIEYRITKLKLHELYSLQISVKNQIDNLLEERNER